MEPGGLVGLHDAVRGAAQRPQVDAILHVVLLQLGQDVFSVRVFPQGRDVGPDLLGQRARRTHQTCLQTDNGTTDV